MRVATELALLYTAGFAFGALRGLSWQGWALLFVLLTIAGALVTAAEHLLRRRWNAKGCMWWLDETDRTFVIEERDGAFVVTGPE